MSFLNVGTWITAIVR